MFTNFDKNYDAVMAIAQDIAVRMNQECVSVEANGGLTLVSKMKQAA